MVVHLFLNNNKALDFLPINSIKNGGITVLFCEVKKQENQKEEKTRKQIEQLGQ